MQDTPHVDLPIGLTRENTDTHMDTLYDAQHALTYAGY
jgi:hypothetical protein